MVDIAIELQSQIATPPAGVHEAPNAEGWTKPAAPKLAPHFDPNDPEPEHRIGIGYVSLFNAYNLGIRYIHALTQARGYTSPLIFFGKISANDVTEPTEVDFENMFRILKKDDCRLIAISVSCSSYYDMAVEITRRIREQMPQSKVLWGGVHVTLCPEDCIKHADYVCLGEGEMTTLELARCLSRGEEPDRIQSLWIRKSNGTIQTNPMREVVRNLDELPFPTWDDRDKHIVMRGQYRQEEIGKNDPYIITMTMRGCPFKCTYCINNRYHNDYREEGMGSLRQRSPQNVIDELRKARDLMPNFDQKVIAFYDDVFSVQVDWITEFADLYTAEFTNRFWCYFHPNLIQEPIIQQLKRMGLTHIDIGIQTGSERIRREYYHRPEKDDFVRNAMAMLQRNEVSVALDVITDIPWETDEDRRESLEFFLSLPKPYEVLFYSLIWFPKVDLTVRALQEGIITRDDVEDRSKKTFEQFVATLDWDGRTPKQMFWIALYYMAARGVYSADFIRWLSKQEWLIRFPQITRYLHWQQNRVIQVKKGFKALGWLATGKMSPKALMARLSNYYIWEAPFGK